MGALRPLNAALLLIAAAAIAGPAWAVFVFEPAPNALAGTNPGPRTLAKIEAMAESACRCRRANRRDAGKDSCWEEFDKFVAPYGAGSSSEQDVVACGVTGIQRICFAGMAWEDCIIIDTSERGECNAEERSIIEAIWPGWERYYDDPVKYANALEAERRAHEAFARGDRLKLPPPGGGTGGGGC